MGRGFGSWGGFLGRRERVRPRALAPRASRRPRPHARGGHGGSPQGRRPAGGSQLRRVRARRARGGRLSGKALGRDGEAGRRPRPRPPKPSPPRQHPPLIPPGHGRVGGGDRGGRADAVGTLRRARRRRLRGRLRARPRDGRKSAQRRRLCRPAGARVAAAARGGARVQLPDGARPHDDGYGDRLARPPPPRERCPLGATASSAPSCAPCPAATPPRRAWTPCWTPGGRCRI